MPFEFDPDKSASNEAKHGIDFVDAQALWKDERRLEFDARTTNERRLVTVGLIDGRHWTAVFTLRNERIRLISVRRARREERKWYEDNNGE